MTCTAATNSAPSSRYSSASEPITTISDRALFMGCFCTSRLTAPPTHSAAKMKNRTRGNMVNCRSLQRHDQAGDDDIRNGQRQKKLPAEGHELVITETRQCAADPDVDKYEDKHAHGKPEHR